MGAPKARHYTIGVLFGGRSPEHEVSLQSARNVMSGLSAAGHSIIPVGVRKSGEWCVFEDPSKAFVAPEDPTRIALSDGGRAMTILPFYDGSGLRNVTFGGDNRTIDVWFPLIHGIQGEDGTLQGLLEMSGCPYVGPQVREAAVTFDKITMKSLFATNEIPTARYLTLDVTARDNSSSDFSAVTAAVGAPFFVKPSNTGSSIGVSKVRTKAEFDTAIQLAFQYDRIILCEEAIACREIELAVFGFGDDVSVSLPGEIIPTHEFYSYAAKYLDPNGARLCIPAELTTGQVRELQDLARRAYHACGGSSLARIDFFLRRESGEILCNELNTLPGFTNISMYPKLWEASGLGYSELLARLVSLAIDRHESQRRISTNFLELGC